ncbi:PREDICTED: uncharacterized protein LOC108764925 [Trachymyrmex cornetzi]|uniref:uncharacterized protein LOC108764925 n=1 Tax=Trachymyrmex cornetzi TaxID=471704 RepID=UPI00084ED1E4|nr:PREDICTED: uncharacterized protein LOC108764925 [Trachymyrmex cornetzi]
MYRKIIVHENDRDCQRILWRFSTSEPIQEFRLNTVTYGETSSAYLALRCIRVLAKESEHEFPLVSRMLSEQTYVDDILAGADSPDEAALLQEQITTTLKTGGFETHKWCSNNKEVLAKIPHKSREEKHRHMDTSETIKTLGLIWNPDNDQFQFHVHGHEEVATKREILSAISKIFDPIGLIGPVLTAAKIIMQETWRTGCQWDESLPEALEKKWKQFRQDLAAAKTLYIPRRAIAFEHIRRIGLQGFCDASEHAYGACLYLQVEDRDGVHAARLLCSKSRIAPLRRISIPRLELCGAVLLARLMFNVQRALQIQFDDVQAWSDSQVALCWIRGDPSR